MRQLSQLQDTVITWRQLEKKVSELAELIDLALAEGERSLESDTSAEIAQLERQLQGLEFQLAFSGEYDNRNALLAVHSGAGGTESQDWSQMLVRMYLRWAELHRFEAEVLDLSPGEEAGVKNALMAVKGAYAYGYLKAEHGVHRLVRLSPFDADHARHTSFALIEVMPEVESEVEVSINPEELKVETFRSSGPGGQHMQKTSTAVRITHLPTGLVATCQNERSQLRNKETALRILRSRLLELELEKKAEEQARLKGEHISAGWGNQIRSYVLHPYKMVKDHRTGYETSDAAAVLDGELDEFIKAYLKSTL
jgi:peptide chain release factor 2